MVLGEVYAITIELFPIANLFCRGHRPRLDISNFRDVWPASVPDAECSSMT
jgi:predicted acyl esterase